MVSDDDLLNDLIETARRDVENDTGKKLITQTIDYFPKGWPSGDRIKIPFGNLQSVSFIKWRDTDGVETNLTKTIIKDISSIYFKNPLNFASSCFGLQAWSKLSE